MAGINVASGNSFVATIDALKKELGDERWITVSGISATLKTEPMDEGGTSTHQRFVTGGLSYSDLVLTRAVDEKSKALVSWFASHAYKVIPGTGSVRIMKPDGKPLHTYSFSHLVPISYKGPDLGMDKGTSVATESVTFKHYGFADTLNGTSAGGSSAPVKA
ncbi:MAG: phage tail protein [Acidimicrobiales bacterium]